jgi:nucleotide-binding universal stress UspA family protein
MTSPVLDWAGFLVQRFAAEAVVAYVLSTELFGGSVVLAGGLTLPEPNAWRQTLVDREPAVRDTERWLEEQVRHVPGRERMTPVVIADFCRPAECLVAEAARRGSELIVVGSRGAGAACRLLFGSVAEAVLRDSSRPTLVVVPPGGATDS